MPSSEWTKRKKQTLKIGHGGTLDSAARGVLGKRCDWEFSVTVTSYQKEVLIENRQDKDKAKPGHFQSTLGSFRATGFIVLFSTVALKRPEVHKAVRSSLLRVWTGPLCEKAFVSV